MTNIKREIEVKANTLQVIYFNYENKLTMPQRLKRISELEEVKKKMDQACNDVDVLQELESDLDQETDLFIASNDDELMTPQDYFSKLMNIKLWKIY